MAEITDIKKKKLEQIKGKAAIDKPVNVTDSSFSDFIKKYPVVVVDAYTDWCVSTDSHIALTNHDIVEAKNLKNDSKVLCFKENRLAATSVIKSFESQKSGHCKLIETESGRNIKTTNDHLFFTKNGWKSAEDLSINDSVAIHPSLEKLNESVPDITLVDEGMILNSMEKRMTHKDYARELKELGLLHLKMNNQKLILLSRLMGSLFSDGNLYIGKNNYREISFTVGSIHDAEEIESGLNFLGLKAHIKEKTSENNILGRKFTTHCYRVKCCSTSLWLLFKALGAPVGNKTNIDCSIPSWLMKSSKTIQREFLSGYLGGDGPKPIMLLSEQKKGSPYNHLLINDIEFHKNPKLLKNGLKFARQLSELFSNFGIKIRKVFSEDEKYVRKDGIVPKIIHLRFATDYENGFNLCCKIGYSYCKQKHENAVKIGEFLRKRICERKHWKEKYNEAMQLYNKGHTAKEISKKLNLSYETVFGWVKRGNKPTTFKHHEKYEVWLKTESINDGLFWDKISKVEEIYLKSVQVISTKEPHNFFANDFLVHNCGPCKMMAPVIDELAKEFSGKVVFGKLDVDANPQTSAQFGIMSIPTLLFFKNGEYADTSVGFGGKEALKKKIEEMLG